MLETTQCVNIAFNALKKIDGMKAHGNTYRFKPMIKEGSELFVEMNNTTCNIKFIDYIKDNVKVDEIKKTYAINTANRILTCYVFINLFDGILENDTANEKYVFIEAKTPQLELFINSSKASFLYFDKTGLYRIRSIDKTLDIDMFKSYQENENPNFLQLKHEKTTFSKLVFYPKLKLDKTGITYLDRG
jgi:hypothetical protein